jgi:hypothetical protein
MVSTTHLRNVIGLILMTALLMGCAGADEVPGIDSPLKVGDVELRFTSATKQESYSVSFDQKMRPNEKNDLLLVVEAAVITGHADMDAVQAWGVSVQDEDGREDKPGMTQTGVMDGEEKILWVFAVLGDSQSLVFKLPEGQKVPLDSLLKE